MMNISSSALNTLNLPGLLILATSFFSFLITSGEIRIVISCLALPVAGRPTRRACLSSSSVDSGISEKSISLFLIRFSFFANRDMCPDDADRFFTYLKQSEFLAPSALTKANDLNLYWDLYHI